MLAAACLGCGPDAALLGRADRVPHAGAVAGPRSGHAAAADRARLSAAGRRHPRGAHRRRAACVARGAQLVASGGRTLYFAPHRSSVAAVDAGTGAIRWRADHVATASATASDTLLFAESDFTSSVPSNGTSSIPSNDALELAASDGHRVRAWPGYWSGTMLHGFYYASRASPDRPEAFAAYDAGTGRELWSNAGTSSVGGPPTLVGATLLQSFSESGAISLNAMHAFDVVTGRELWRTGLGPRPLGTGPGVVYLDTTWFPLQLDDYVLARRRHR